MRGIRIPLVASPSLHLQPLYKLQARCMSQAQFSVIKIPVSLQEKQRREIQKEKRRQKARQIHQSRTGNQNISIITCRRKELNHYFGQTYSKFDEIPLASKGWLHKKAAGDYFTINSQGANPAFEHFDSDSEEDFASLGLEKDLVSQLHKMGFERPTNIQSLAIPHVLDRKNTLITAETGNGKTLAFIGPMLQQIAERKKALRSELPMNSPMGLVIVPGKELAAQIHEVASKIGQNLGIKVKLLVGDKTKKRMLTPPMSQIELLVASFGALSKLTTVGVYNTNYVTHIALDEADTLLDDSFNQQLTHYITKYPIQSADVEHPEALSGVQLTLVAATAPRNMEKILHPIVELDSLVHVSTPYLNRLMAHVPQRFLRVNNRTKVEKLMELVKKDAKKGSPVIVFSNNSKTADWVFIFLTESGVGCVNLNGVMPSSRRQEHYKAFVSGEVKVLSCTDLASRGLDTREVSHVINYNFPNYIADYIHRCGRTGRVGGTTSSLITNLVHKPREVELVQKIEYAVRKGEEFHNVNANIKRIITARIQRGQEEGLKSIL